MTNGSTNIPTPARAHAHTEAFTPSRRAHSAQPTTPPGFEPLAQKAYLHHPTARDVAYAALRDMGVPYAETATGKAQAERAARAIAAGDRWREVKPVDM